MGNVHNGVIPPALQRTRWPFGVPSRGTGSKVPSLRIIVEIHGLIRRGEYQGTGYDLCLRYRRRTGTELLAEFVPGRRALGHGNVPSGLDKSDEVGVSDFGGVQPKARHPYRVSGFLRSVRLLVVSAHEEFGPGTQTIPLDSWVWLGGAGG